MNNVGNDLRECPEVVRLRMAWHLWHCDEDSGRRVAQLAGIELDKARALAPLPGHPAPHRKREQTTSTSSQQEEPPQPRTQEPAAAR